MKTICLGVAAVALALGFAACNDDNPWVHSDGEGKIAPRVAADPTVHDVRPQTKENGFPVPQPSDLKLTLTKTDGTFTQSWDNMSLFPTDKLFKIGAYTLEASYGDEDVEGFECPYFYGSAEFSVTEDEVAEPSVTAKLANSMVSVDYTEDFKNFFKAYSTQLHSAGGDFITYIPGETRPAFLKPGTITVTMSITKQNGISATIEPAMFTAKPQHHYHLTFDVNGGETGDAQLVVNFDESLTQEDVVIDLSDDLMLSPEPKVTAQGFVPDEPVQLVEGSMPEQASAFIITAMGGLSSVTLTTESTQLISLGFPAEIDLMSASEAQKSLLTQFGLDVKGLWRNPDKMASIDFTKVLANIKGTGTHKFSLVVKDKLSKVNLPVTAVYTTEPVVLEVTSAPGVTLNATQADVYVRYNGASPEKNITIESMDSYGVWKQCKITSIESTATRAASGYKITFDIPESYEDINARICYKGVEKDQFTIVRSGAALKVVSQADVWATHATLKLIKKASTEYSSISYYISEHGGSYALVTPSVDEATGMVTFSGLKAGTTYTVKASDTGGIEGAHIATPFATETALQPQHGTMDSWSHDEGWQNKIAGIGNKTIYRYYPGSGENEYWATRNAFTTCKDFGTASCYYNVYSGTYYVDGVSGAAAEICSVGWAKDGTNTFTALGGNCNVVTPGLLFMGTYSYDKDTDTEHINLGRPFTSRPTSVKFDYKYAPQDSESFQVLVVVENRDGGTTTELARGVFESNTAVSSYTSHTVNLTYTNTSLKATHAYVYFVSSTSTSPGKHNVRGSEGAFAGYSDSRYTGSVLNVDNIVFNY